MEYDEAMLRTKVLIAFGRLQEAKQVFMALHINPTLPSEGVKAYEDWFLQLVEEHKTTPMPWPFGWLQKQKWFSDWSIRRQIRMDREYKASYKRPYNPKDPPPPLPPA